MTPLQWADKALKELGQYIKVDDLNEFPNKTPKDMQPLEIDEEVREFMKDDCPIDCPHLKLLKGCMNCEYEELYKYVRCTKHGSDSPCISCMNLHNFTL